MALAASLAVETPCLNLTMTSPEPIGVPFCTAAAGGLVIIGEPTKPTEGFGVLADRVAFCARDMGTRRSVTTRIVAIMSVKGLRTHILLTTPSARVVLRARYICCSYVCSSFRSSSLPTADLSSRARPSPWLMLSSWRADSFGDRLYVQPAPIRGALAKRSLNTTYMSRIG